jgi:ureidoglycolate lyase
MTRRLACEALTAEAFARFGVVIDPSGRAPETINAGTTQRFADLARLDLRRPDRDPVLGLYVARARAVPLRLEKLERHRQAAQVFMPLGMFRFVAVVAPPDETPDWAGVRAFITAPGQGLALHRGCWHHGLIALGDADRFAVIEGGNYRQDVEEAAAPEIIELAPPR